MSRRAAILLALAALVLGPRVLCPRGLAACLQPAAPAHDCCAPPASVDADRCCCTGPGRVAETPAAAEAARLSLSGTASAAPAPAAAAADPDGAAAVPPDMLPAVHGPPATLLIRQTVLLL